MNEAMSPSQQIKSAAILILTAAIWGAAFVAQSTGGHAIGPITFSCTRYYLATLAQLPFIAMLDRAGMTRDIPRTPAERRTLFVNGVLCGIFMCLTSVFQMLGIYMGTSAGKAGFLTTCYIVIVPVLGMFFFKRRCGWNVWLAVAVALVGLYLLCITESYTIEASDLMVLACSLANSLQILTVDRCLGRTEVVRLAVVQSATVGVVLLPFMYITEMHGDVAGWAAAFATPGALIPLLYAGVMSSGVAHVLQNVGQRGIDPTVASLIMSLEAVFAVIAGWLILDEVMTARETIGCVVLFAAVILAQLPLRTRR